MANNWWDDMALSDAEQALLELQNHSHPVVAEAFEHCVDSEWTVEEYIEYIESMDAADYRKYYGYDDPRKAYEILRGAVANKE